MSEEVKQTVVRFSLPYREGMESEVGFKEKVEATSKTYEGETVFAKFEILPDESLVIDDAKALEFGRKQLRMNQTRSNAIGAYASKFGLAAAGGGGKVTKADKMVLESLAALGVSIDKIQAVVKAHSKTSAFLKGLDKEALKAEVEAVKA